jgi:hypothetical protein
MRHVKAGKIIQNQKVVEPIHVNNSQITEAEIYNCSNKTDNMATVDEQLVDFSPENPAVTDDIFSFDNFF